MMSRVSLATQLRLQVSLVFGQIMQRSLRLLGSAVALRVLAFVYFSSRPQLGYLFESRGVAAEDVSECVFLLSR